MLRPEEEITSSWKSNKICVSITCITYNHERYIAQAIESFLMQITDFAFEIIIHDDASSDNTQAIIQTYAKKYPNLIIPILQKENYWLGKGINATTGIVWPNARGKYIAWCEGDDYWTNPYKLQMQYDYLEQNLEISICGHVTSIIQEGLEYSNEESIPYRPHKTYINKILGFDDIIQMIIENGPIFHTSSFMFHKSKLTIPSFVNKLPVTDYMILMLLTKVGKAYVLPSNCSVYRMNNSGITSVYKQNKITINKNKIYFFSTMAKHLNETQNPMIRKKIIEGYKGLSDIYIRKKQWVDFLKNLFDFFCYDKKLFIQFYYQKTVNCFFK